MKGAAPLEFHSVLVCAHCWYIRLAGHGRWQSRIARQAVELVGQEETDDLFFEQGHHSQELIKLVVSLHIAPVLEENQSLNGVSKGDSVVKWCSCQSCIHAGMLPCLEMMNPASPLLSLPSPTAPMQMRVFVSVIHPPTVSDSHSTSHSDPHPFYFVLYLKTGHPCVPCRAQAGLEAPLWRQ